MKTPPDKFTITITEKDRQTADCYDSRCHCLVGTALRRRGYAGVVELVFCVQIDGVAFRHEPLGSQDLAALRNATKRPFYGKRVVGKRITFTRA